MVESGIMDSLEAVSLSWSLGFRRDRASQAKVRSTTQRLGSGTKPLASFGRLTISSLQGKRFCFFQAFKAWLWHLPSAHTTFNRGWFRWSSRARTRGSAAELYTSVTGRSLV